MILDRKLANVDDIGFSCAIVDLDAHVNRVTCELFH